MLTQKQTALIATAILVLSILAHVTFGVLGHLFEALKQREFVVQPYFMIERLLGVVAMSLAIIVIRIRTGQTRRNPRSWFAAITAWLFFLGFVLYTIDTSIFITEIPPFAEGSVQFSRVLFDLVASICLTLLFVIASARPARVNIDTD